MSIVPRKTKVFHSSKKNVEKKKIFTPHKKVDSIKTYRAPVVSMRKTHKKKWQPFVSIICRAFNEVQSVQEMIDMLRLQHYTHWELLCADTGSTDGTYEILVKNEPHLLLRFQEKDYNPGKILNKLVKRARGEVVIFNNADCIPSHRYWLENLILPLKYPWNGATYCRQVGDENLGLQVLRDLERAYGTGFHNQKWFHFFSFASSAARRKDLLENKINEKFQFCEDMEWSYRMKKKKYQLLYIPSAKVCHRHFYDIKSIQKRSYGEGKALAAIFPEQYKSSNFLRTFGISYLAEIVYDITFAFKSGKWASFFYSIPYSFLYRAMQKLALYKGIRETQMKMAVKRNK